MFSGTDNFEQEKVQKRKEKEAKLNKCTSHTQLHTDTHTPAHVSFFSWKINKGRNAAKRIVC